MALQHEVSVRQLHILKHALGLSQSGKEYRNRFVPGERDVADCEKLKDLGLMISMKRSLFSDTVYHCTDRGRRFAHSN